MEEPQSPELLATPPVRRDVFCLWRGRPDSCLRRRLRHAVVRGIAQDAGDWRTDGARRESSRRTWLDCRPGAETCGLGVLFGLGARCWRRARSSPILYNVTATDPIGLVGVSLLPGVTAIAASFFPARRAMAVDPLAALRREYRDLAGTRRDDRADSCSSILPFLRAPDASVAPGGREEAGPDCVPRRG